MKTYFLDTCALIKWYFNRANNTWYAKIVVKTPKGIIPVSEVIFNSKGDIIDVPTKETLLHILKTRLTEEKERVILKVHAKDLTAIKRVVKIVYIGIRRKNGIQ